MPVTPRTMDLSNLSARRTGCNQCHAAGALGSSDAAWRRHYCGHLLRFALSWKCILSDNLTNIRRRGGVAIQVSAASLIYALVSRKLPQYGSKFRDKHRKSFACTNVINTTRRRQANRRMSPHERSDERTTRKHSAADPTHWMGESVHIASRQNAMKLKQSQNFCAKLSCFLAPFVHHISTIWEFDNRVKVLWRTRRTEAGSIWTPIVTSAPAARVKLAELIKLVSRVMFAEEQWTPRIGGTTRGRIEHLGACAVRYRDVFIRLLLAR